MYIWFVVLVMGALPILSIIVEHVAAGPQSELLYLVGRWFVFWAVGVRLFIAGLRQTARPGFTAEILGIRDPGVHVAIRELGFANLAIGAIGIASLYYPAWTVPAAVAGGVFLGLAGIQHAGRPARNTMETTAMVSDLAVAVIVLAWAGLAVSA